MSINNFFIDLADVKRLDNSFDDYGNIAKSYEVVESGIRCRLVSNSVRENELDRDTSTISGIVYTEFDGIEPEDILVINDKEYQVIGRPLEKKNMYKIHHYEIDVEERKL